MITQHIPGYGEVRISLWPDERISAPLRRAVSYSEIMRAIEGMEVEQAEHDSRADAVMRQRMGRCPYPFGTPEWWGWWVSAGAGRP